MEMIDARNAHGWIQHAVYVRSMCILTCALRAVVIEGVAGNAHHTLVDRVRRDDPQQQALNPKP